MDVFKLIYRILKQIRALELAEEHDLALLSPDAMKATEIERDNILLKMQEEGLITGLAVIKGIDGQQRTFIMWQSSMPRVTLKGLEYMEENSMMKKAKNLLKGFVEIVK